MPDSGGLALIVTGALSMVGSLLAGGAGVRFLLRRQEGRLADAEALAKRADAAARLADASVAQISQYRETAERYMRRVEELHGGLLEAHSAIADLSRRLKETVAKLRGTESQLLAARGELTRTSGELAHMRDAHALSRHDLDEIGRKLREAEVRSVTCERDRAILAAELTVLRSKLSAFDVQLPDDETGAENAR